MFTTKSAQLVNETITFPLINLDWVILLHEDALVLTLGLSGFDVRKILVDLSNSIDLLQMSTYMQMGYPLTILKNLENLGQVPFGFNEATTISFGDFVLPIQVDPVTLNVRFFVVEDLSP